VAFDVFFFQAEDGIRYRTVTGVQTCALPISAPEVAVGTPAQQPVIEPAASAPPIVTLAMSTTPAPVLAPAKVGQFTPVPTFSERSEERRVGKECRARCGTRHGKEGDECARCR